MKTKTVRWLTRVDNGSVSCHSVGAIFLNGCSLVVSILLAKFKWSVASDIIDDLVLTQTCCLAANLLTTALVLLLYSDV